MKKKILLVGTLLVVMVSVIPALADGVGGIRISPSYPTMVASPADFEIWKTDGGYLEEPWIFLAMSKSCYDNMWGDVWVDWDGNLAVKDLVITKGEFNPETDEDKKVPVGAGYCLVEGAEYTVKSLRSHLGITVPIYWAFKPFLPAGAHIMDSSSPTPFTVGVESDDEMMLVYVLAKYPGSECFDARIPPTEAGFVIPEPATIVAIATSVAALVGYTVYRKKHL